MLIVDLKVLSLIMTSNFPIGRLKPLVIKTSLLPAAARLVKVGEEMILSKEIKRNHSPRIRGERGVKCAAWGLHWRCHQPLRPKRFFFFYTLGYNGYQDYSGEPCDPAIYADCDTSYGPQPQLTGHCKGERALLGATTY